MKKTISVYLSVIILIAIVFVLFASNAAGPEAGDNIDSLGAVTVTPHSLSLLRGQAYQLSAYCNPMYGATGVTWISSNDSIVSVTSYGLVVGKSAGTATVTAVGIIEGPIPEGLNYTDSCVITVSSERIVENGTYFIQTAQTNSLGEILDRFVSVEGESNSNGTEMVIEGLSGSHYKKWDIILGTDGYYRLRSYATIKYMRVTDSSSIPGASITQNSSVVSGAKWAFILTPSGNLAIVPASSTSSLVVMNLPSNSCGSELNTATYSSDNDYSDEWVLTRMLPLSGYELPYTTVPWPMGSDFNCYQYAIHTQAKPLTPSTYWYNGQPGEYGNYSISGYGDCHELLVLGVEADYNQYNLDTNAGKYFHSIGKYDLCPVGTYKVALFVGSYYNIYLHELQYDYHWYRQDQDGLWSHKIGNYDADQVDANGKYIIDPELAARCYSNCDYNSFVGYFALTPWNHMILSDGLNNLEDDVGVTAKETVIQTLLSWGATTEYDRAVYSLSLDSSTILIFDCEQMIGYILKDGQEIPINSDFFLKVCLLRDNL